MRRRRIVQRPRARSGLLYTITGTVGCAGSCTGGQTCVEIATGDFACAEEFVEIPSDDLIPGVGLFASLALTSTGGPVIAYYDRIDGDLEARPQPARRKLSPSSPSTGADPSAPLDPGPDVGQHASVAFGPGGRIAVAYFDATNDDLVYYDLTDDIRTDRRRRRLAARPALRRRRCRPGLRCPNGEPTIAYQDPTFIDLLFARRVEGVWSTEVLRGTVRPGSRAASIATQAQRGSTAFVGGVDVDFTTEGDLRLELVIVPKTLP